MKVILREQFNILPAPLDQQCGFTRFVFRNSAPLSDFWAGCSEASHSTSSYAVVGSVLGICFCLFRVLLLRIGHGLALRSGAGQHRNLCV